MIQSVDFHILELDVMKKYPKELFYIGKTELLGRPKISIVGSRKPNQYARQFSHEIASKLSQAGVCIVSGGAIGVDAISHKAAGAGNTIMVAGTGLDTRYPAINKNIIQEIEKEGLVLSQFQSGIASNKYHFPLRNELIVALGEVLIVTYADISSGTMRSVEYALKMGKEIYVLPHRIGESEGTNRLLYNGFAKGIHDVDAFVAKFTKAKQKESVKDEFLEYCKTNPRYEAAVAQYGAKVFEYELSGKISVKLGRIGL
ncbi:DNA-protecting protein DprA [bacterium]|nr:DNA-protecting protein DprA [bacterium]MBU1994209.1 DNA-protecting protein DprA [bacterium]